MNDLFYIGLIFFFFFCLMILFFKYTKLKTIQILEAKNLENILLENQKLNSEKIELIRQIEHFSTSLKLNETAQDAALKNSKAALYDLSNSVVSKLLELHKKEAEDSRKQSEERIAKSTESFNSEMQKIANLVAVLTKDVEVSKSIVDNLHNSLLSPSSAGSLAEITLENLLKNSGLQQDVDFKLQYSFSGSDQNKLRPDAVVFLPQDNLIIIDAKSSQFIVNNQNEADLMRSMTAHLKSLTSKDYTSELREYYTKKDIKFGRVSTIMFMPTEQAIDRISKMDKTFIQKAWDNNIFPVGPSGLMNILSIAKMHISEKQRIDNYELIIQEINGLINSIGTISEHGAKLGNNIASLISNYDKFAASFNRNLVSKVKNLKILGTGSNSKSTNMLERYQIVSHKNDLIEAEEIREENPIKLKNVD